jgi:hypothetical protein
MTMIITSATKAIESGDNTKRGEPIWKYWSIRIGNDIYRIVFEYNHFYGDLVRQWSINGNTETNVKWQWKELEGFVSFDVSNGLCGERAFENDSITWEFLLKPMGIKYETIKRKYITDYDMENLLEANGIEYVELYKQNY